MDDYLPYDITGVSPSKQVKETFDEYYVPELEKCGFVRKKGIWVRKKGTIFQAFGRDGMCIRYFIHPFWINKQEETPCYDYIAYNRKGSLRMSTCYNINFPETVSPIFAPKESLEYFKDSFLTKLENVDSEVAYLDYCRTTDDQILVNDYLVLYVSYLKGSIDYAKDYIEEAFQKCYLREYECVFKMISKAFKGIESGNYYTWDTPRPRQGAFVTKEDIELYNQGISPEEHAKSEAERYLESVKEVRFNVVERFLESKSHDYSVVLDYQSRKSDEMRSILKIEYGLDF